MRVPRLGDLVLPLLVLGVSANAVAHDPDGDTGTLPPVDVTAHYVNGVGSSDAASQGVVSGELLQDIPLLRPGEALETVPGLVVTQHSGDGKANQYFLRGYNLDHGTDFATSVDGVPVNMPTNAHGQGYSDLNFLIPELVDHIDYRKGTYYAENGDFSAAGSADIHYRRTLAHDLAGFTLGQDGFRRALLAGSRAADPDGPSLLGGVELQEEDGPWSTPERLRKANLLLRLGEGGADQGWSVDGVLYQAHWNSTDQVPLELITSGQLGRFQALDPSDGGDTGRDILSGEWHRADGDGYTRVSAFLEHYRLQLWSDFTFFELRNGLAPDPALPSDQFEQAENRNVVGARAVHGWIHTLAGRESVSEAGLQLRRDSINLGLLDTQSRVPFATVSDDSVEETGIGAWLRNTTSWTPWLRSVAGIRSDHVAMDQMDHRIALNSGSAGDSKLSPKLSLVLGPWSATEFFASAGRGFHSNDARGVIDRIDPTNGAAASPVPALVAAFGEELGLRSELVPGLQTSLALWKLDSDSELVYNADSDIGSTSANGASKRSGVEWNNHYVAGRWLFLDADLAWTHARYAHMNDNGALGDYIPNAVPKVGRFGATVHDLGPWSGALELRYFAGYPLSQDGSLMAPSASIANLRLSRTIAPEISVSLDVLNLFDRKYYDIAYEQDYQVAANAPVVPSGITVHPGEPRELRLSLRWTP